MSERVQWLRRQLELLSSGAMEQLQYLEQEGMLGCVDELALDYDAVAAAAGDMLQRGELNQQQRDSVAQLNEFLKFFSGEKNQHLWTPEALQSAPEWQRVRSMADNCLALLG